jgi:type IV pilus assembly protein PilV
MMHAPMSTTRVRNLSASSRTCGFTLIEVLVSIVVLSVGLLGIAKLVMFSAHANDSAYLRSRATELAYAILDDMRSNQTGAIAHEYDVALGTAPVNPGFTCVAATACTTQQQAQYDVYNWQLRLNANSGISPPGALPAGRGSVTTSYVSQVTMAVITVQWDDSAAQTVFAGTSNTAPSWQSITLETVVK